MAPKVKKATKKNVDKYSTPLVGEVFDQVSQTVLTGVKKNAKTAVKWMAKMKLSIQRKVQVASRVVFVGEGWSCILPPTPGTSRCAAAATPKPLALCDSLLISTLKKTNSHFPQRAKPRIPQCRN